MEFLRKLSCIATIFVNDAVSISLLRRYFNNKNLLNDRKWTQMKPRILKLFKISAVLLFPGRYYTFLIQTMVFRNVCENIFLFKGSSRLITEAYKDYTHSLYTFCRFSILVPALYCFFKQFLFYRCIFCSLILLSLL